MTSPLKLAFRRFENLDLMKEEELAYWQSRPASERLHEGMNLTAEAYGLKGYAADVMYEDFKQLLSVLNPNKVCYLIVGGHAVSIHAQPRATKNLDLWMAADPANSAALFKALSEFGAHMEGVTSQTLLKEGECFRLGVPPCTVDILCDVKGVAFEQAWASKLIVTVDQSTGLAGYLINREHLIAVKKAAGRPLDIADVHAMEKAMRYSAV